jgi:parallel beta-helix repeat protein
MSNRLPFVRQTAAVLLAFGLIASVPVAHAAADPIEVHVAPTGDDAGDGSRAKPVASLMGARDAVRRLRAAGRTGPVRVVMADGTYRVAKPLVLTPEDGGSAEAPVRYEAAPGAKPVFSGGRKITGFRALENGLWVADVPAVAAGQWYFEQLWVDGRRARRAMEPDTGQFFFDQVDETDLGRGRFRQTVTVSPQVMSLLTPLSATQRADVKLLVFHSWNNTHRFLSAIDAGSRSFSCEGPKALRPYSLWKDLAWGSKGYFHLENFLSALDEPGEWFLARDGKLYYKPRPGEDPAAMEFVAPVTGQFLLVQGDPAGSRFVEHVHFKGLAFHHGQWLTPAGGYGPFQAASNIEAVVMLDGARNVVFEDCEIAHMGIYGLWFRRGCSQCRVERCLISDLGAGGVKIGEIRILNNPAEQTHHITLDNNIIHSGGRIFTDAVGVWIGHSGDNAVTHNDIGDFFYSAVSVGWTWGFGKSVAKRNHISFNRLHHLGQRRMSDLAGVYTLGISDGTVVSHNVIHDVYRWGYGGWGLYTDEGSSNILLENNLVYNVSDGGFKQHYGRDNTVRNNILAFSENQQVQGTAQQKAGDHLSFTFERNIVYFDQGELFGKAWQWAADVIADLRNNIYWRADGQSFDFAGKSWDQWRAMGRDQGSVIADPKFVDPDNYDFRFASDEVIQQTGFQPFDYSQAGVYGDATWIALAKTTIDSMKDLDHDETR